MTTAQLQDLKDVVGALNSNELLVRVDRKFLEVIKVSGHEAVEIRGNREGLLLFANRIAELALRGGDGDHFHLHPSNLVDNCEIDTFISYLSSPTELDQT